MATIKGTRTVLQPEVVENCESEKPHFDLKLAVTVVTKE